MIPKVGSEVDAWCTKCRMDLGHRVVAVLEARPKRVECLTCHSQHNYRKPKGAGELAVVSRSGARAARTVAKGEPRARRMTKSQAEYDTQWQAKVLDQPQAKFVRYTIKQPLKEGQLLEHSKFGRGFVLAVQEDGKVSVAFKDGPKTLAHARE